MDRKKLSARPKKVRYIDGERFNVLGKSCQLTLSLGRGHGIIGDEIIKLPVSDFSSERVKSALEKCFKRKAQEILIPRTQVISQKIGMHPNKIDIKKYKARWGSCSDRGEISLNWKLIHHPLIWCDYVIVHELCHLVHFNHSKSFWQLVEKYYPDYKNAKRYFSRQNCA